MRVIETEAKSIMVASKLPDADFVMNPYTGCAFGCSYCYASFMGRYVGETVEAWGDYVYVKTNAVELARQEVESKLATKGDATLLMSSVTDPYQGVESKYRLARGILEVLADAQWPGTVGILTKSPLVTRDIDVISRLPHPSVGMTVTTTDDEISGWLEVRAPRASARLRALRQLSDAGLPTYAFVGPLLPHFRWQLGLLESLFREIAEAGVRDIYVEHINLKSYIRSRLEPRLANEPPEVKEAYVAARRDDHRAALTDMVESLRTKYGLWLRLDEVLYHQAGVAQAAVKAAAPGVRSDGLLKNTPPREKPG